MVGTGTCDLCGFSDGEVRGFIDLTEADPDVGDVMLCHSCASDMGIDWGDDDDGPDWDDPDNQDNYSSLEDFEHRDEWAY